MNYKEKEKIVRRIVLGKVFAKVKWKQEEIPVQFIDPSQDILYEADLIYDEKYQSCIDNEVLTLEESHQLLIDRGDWSKEEETKLETIQKEIKILQSELTNSRFQKNYERSLLNSIEKGKRLVKELSTKKNQLFDTTAEFIAERSRKHFIISKIANINIPKEVSPHFLDLLSISYFDTHMINEEQLREIARSDPWRLYWSMIKETGNSLFKTAITEITQYQYLLCSWSRMYDFAFENQDRPSDEIIEDNERFDAWCEAQIKKNERERNIKSIEDRFPKNNSGIGRQEIFFLADSEGAKEVFELNDGFTRKALQAREKFIKEKGVVRDQELPDVKKDLRMAMNQYASQETQKRLH